jgi:hypothetical protein
VTASTDPAPPLVPAAQAFESREPVVGAPVPSVDDGPPPCPAGTEAKGAGPPAGDEAWCEREGKREGPYTHWNALGGWEEQTMYEGGLASGPSVRWDEQGRISERGAYKDDARVGRWQTYREGRLALAGDFVDGEQHGSFVDYAGNGAKQAEGQYRHGVPCGTFRCWDWTNGNGEPTGCVPLEHLCEITATGVECGACADDSTNAGP